jgi:hypothetical protein
VLIDSSTQLPARKDEIEIDASDRWIGARFLPADQYLALQLILEEGMVESAVAAATMTAHLRAETRRRIVASGADDQRVHDVVDSLLEIVGTTLVELQAEQRRIVLHTLRRARADLGLGPNAPHDGSRAKW